MASIIARNGSYLIMVSGGYDAKGKQIRKTMTWRSDPEMTEKQNEKALNEQAMLFERSVVSGQVLEGNMKFFEFAERWLKDYGEKQLAPKTLARYRAMFERIEPAIGHIRLDKIQPHHLMELYDKLGNQQNRKGISFVATDTLMKVFEQSGLTRKSISEKTGASINAIYNLFQQKPVSEQTAKRVCKLFGVSFQKGFKNSKEQKNLSNKTIQHHHRMISAMLNTAVQWQLILNNPAQRVKPPKVQRTEAKYLDEKQTAELIALLEKAPVQNRMMILFLIYSGLRRGELCGLEWGDIDFENHLISVKRTSQYLPGKGIFTKETKTESSVRTIKLASQVFEFLKDFKRWQLEQQFKMGDRWVQSNRLFTAENGSPIHPDSITAWFHNFIAKTNLPRISIHSLRHTNITLMIAAGVPIRTVSHRAGHAQTTTTINLYSHAIQTADEMAAEALGDILTPKSILKTKKTG